MAKVRALVFDVDGTLADTERDGHRLAFNLAFADAGLDWDWTVELYGDLLNVTGGKERIRYYLERFGPNFKRPDDLSGFIAELHRSKTGHYTKLVADGSIPLRTGVRRLLGEARDAGLRLAIATTTTPANVFALIQSNLPEGAIDWFDVIGAGDVVSDKKPAPDIYTWVLQRLRLSPTDVIAFEDSENGVTSAAAAGIDAIVVTTNCYTLHQDFAAAAAVCDSFGEPNSPANFTVGEPASNGVVDLAYLHGMHAASSQAS